MKINLKMISIKKPIDYATAGIGVLGFIIFMIAGSALIGYLTEWHSGYFWFVLPMAPNTAVMGVATGICLMLTGYKLNDIIYYVENLAKKINDFINKK